MFDLQVNGLTTADFSCDFWQQPSFESIDALRKHELDEGISHFLATLITAPYDSIEANLKHINDYKKQFDMEAGDPDSAHIFGVHMEGGLISKMGIHPEAHAQEFNLANVKSLVEQYPNLIKLWTLCPRMDTNGEVTKYLQDQNIKVAYGHSEANYEEAMQAFDDYGVDLVTHWCNGMKTMPGFKHRGGTTEDFKIIENFDIKDAMDVDEIGIAVAALHNPKVTVTAICGSEPDGDLHLDSYLVHKLAESKKDKFILVSDSVAAADGKQHDHSQLRGGTMTLGKHLVNALEAMVDIETVQAATSILPYEIMGIKSTASSI